MRLVYSFSLDAEERGTAPGGLSRQYRAWIALYALDANERPRAEILRINEVTETDLAEFEASWLQLRRRTGSTQPSRSDPADTPPAGE